MIEPTPYQTRILQVPEALNLALLGGRGGGKTHAAVLLAIRHAVAYGARARILIIRSTYKSLAQLYGQLEGVFHAAFAGKVACNRADMVIRCANGAAVTLGNLSQARDYHKYQGQETTLLIVDEATNLPTLRYVNLLRANMRGPAGVPIRMVIIGNPGGPMHAALARQFVHGRRPWAEFRGDDGEAWVYAPSTYRDNPHIDQDRYQASIVAAAGNDRALAAAWLDNSWDDIAGAFFAGVWGDHLLLPEDPGWRIPRGPLATRTGLAHWHSFVALDWGMSAPSVALLCARPTGPGQRGPGGRIFPPRSLLVIDEVATADPQDPTVGLGWPPQMLAEEITAACARTGVRPVGVGDDARGLDQSTLLDQLRRFGLSLRKPVKDRISGWVAVKQMMAAAKADDPDQPGIWISERCRYSLETIPVLPRSPIRPEDCDTNAADHAADALRYAVNYQPRFSRISTVTGV